MANWQVGDLADCRRCGGLMMIGERRENLCGQCWRHLDRVPERAAEHAGYRGLEQARKEALR